MKLSSRVWLSVIFAVGLLVGWFWRGFIDQHADRDMLKFSAKSVFKQLVEDVERDPTVKPNLAKIRGRFQLLHEFGEDGSKEIYAFLRGQEDIVLVSGFGFSDGRLSQFPSLRTALIDALYDYHDPTAREANLDVLKKTSSGLEVLLASRNLERYWPGQYRPEALKAVSEVLTQASKSEKPDPAPWMTAQMFEVVGYYQGEELIPQIEEAVRKDRSLANSWVMTMTQFSTENQIGSLQRMFANDVSRSQLIENSQLLAHYRLDDPRVRREVVQIYKKLSSAQKEFFLQQLRRTATIEACPNMMNLEQKASFSISQKKNRLQACLAMLKEVEPSSSAQKKRLESIRKEFEQQMKLAVL
jgi:hypothetical protein